VVAKILLRFKTNSIYYKGIPPKDQKAKGKQEQDRWADALASAKEGNFDDIDPQIQICQFPNLQKIYKREQDRTELADTTHKAIWIYGLPGTGKSYLVRNHYKGSVYNKDPKIKWFDGFDSTIHKVVHLEDVGREASNQLGSFKHWLDLYPFHTESKGSGQVIRPEVVIVTSNYHPSQIWAPDEVVAILRRVQLHQMMLPYDAVKDPKNNRNLQGPPKLRLPVLGEPAEPDSLKEGYKPVNDDDAEFEEDNHGDLIWRGNVANPSGQLYYQAMQAHLDQDAQFQQVPNVPLVQSRFNNNQIWMGHEDEEGYPMTPSQHQQYVQQVAAAAAAAERDEEESNEAWWQEEMRDEGALLDDDEFYELLDDEE